MAAISRLAASTPSSSDCFLLTTQVLAPPGSAIDSNTRPSTQGAPVFALDRRLVRELHGVTGVVPEVPYEFGLACLAPPPTWFWEYPKSSAVISPYPLWNRVP